MYLIDSSSLLRKHIFQGFFREVINLRRTCKRFFVLISRCDLRLKLTININKRYLLSDLLFRIGQMNFWPPQFRLFLKSIWNNCQWKFEEIDIKFVSCVSQRRLIAETEDILADFSDLFKQTVYQVSLCDSGPFSCIVCALRPYVFNDFTTIKLKLCGLSGAKIKPIAYDYWRVTDFELNLGNRMLNADILKSCMQLKKFNVPDLTIDSSKFSYFKKLIHLSAISIRRINIGRACYDDDFYVSRTVTELELFQQPIRTQDIEMLVGFINATFCNLKYFYVKAPFYPFELPNLALEKFQLPCSRVVSDAYFFPYFSNCREIKSFSIDYPQKFVFTFDEKAKKLPFSRIVRYAYSSTDFTNCVEVKCLVKGYPQDYMKKRVVSDCWYSVSERTKIEMFRDVPVIKNSQYLFVVLAIDWRGCDKIDIRSITALLKDQTKLQYLDIKYRVDKRIQIYITDFWLKRNEIFLRNHELKFFVCQNDVLVLKKKVISNGTIDLWRRLGVSLDWNRVISSYFTIQ